MGKKKIFTKKNSTTFSLVNRSQLDKANEAENDPSKLVLVPKNVINERARLHRAKLKQDNEENSHNQQYRDHIDRFGFPSHGSNYDYESHLKLMGGGTFISKDGKVCKIDRVERLNLPEEVLPSEEEAKRNFNSITISEKVMDKDLQEIINGECDDFEELDDDFVIQAAGEDDKKFDFDAHIARLIGESEKAVGLVPRKPFDYETFDLTEENTKSAVNDENDEISMELFEATLNEYGSDDWGEGQYVSEKTDNFEADKMMENYMNEFIRANKAKDWSTVMGQQEKEITNAVLNLSLDEETAKEIECSSDSSDLKEEEGDEFWENVENEIEYLRPKPQEKWDCETVLSTLSNLDNHPKVLRVDSINPKKNKISCDERAQVDSSAPIELSRKSGLPIGVLETKVAKKDSALPSENLGQKRERKETNEEKRARKAKIKEERKVIRAKKADLQALYKEGAKTATKVMANPETATRRSIFSYS
mmetsp:Transcript_10177/g.14399  ORF Transcript_10177/g.14399 Transcript_10177/m.14399 type:complete len:478 (+) Transcript_10177:70-1503(+)